MDGKTTEIYLIRHGESQANEKNVFIGHGDLDLTEKGKKQAELTAEYLKACHFDVIYSSDLLRAYHTAEATAKKLGLPIVKDERLREIDAGEWDFKTFDDLEKEYQESYGVVAFEYRFIPTRRRRKRGEFAKTGAWRIGRNCEKARWTKSGGVYARYADTLFANVQRK